MANYNKALAVTNATYSNVTPPNMRKVKSLSDRTSKVYEDDDGNVFIGFRGTDVKSASDLFSDAFIAKGLGAYSPRYRTSAEKLKKTQAYYAGSNKEITVVGHSLGGNVASNLARNEKGIKEAYAYNGASNPYYDIQDSLRDKIGGSKTHTPIYAYSTGDDIVSLGVHVPQRNVTATIVPRKQGLDPHTLSNFSVM